jgi:osmotically inducible protein OsmC
MAGPERNDKETEEMATRNGRASWEGDVRAGSGRLIVGEDAWTAGYSWSRFAGLDPESEESTDTNPEEVLAAAHAACFAMALSMQLSEAGHAPTSIETLGRVHLRVVEGMPTIQQIDLDAEAQVPGLEEAAFPELVERAKATCILSRALGGVEQINVSASLAT